HRSEGERAAHRREGRGLQPRRLEADGGSGGSARRAEAVARAMATPSPLAPERFPDLPPIAGVRLASAACGIRYQDRTDLMVAVLDPGTTIAGVLTKSLTHGAPVAWCRGALKHGKARGIVVNSGNSNTFTGRAGRAVVTSTARTAAKLLKCSP